MKFKVLRIFVLCYLACQASFSFAADTEELSRNFISAVQDSNLGLVNQHLASVQDHVVLAQALQIAVESGYVKIATSLLSKVQFDKSTLIQAQQSAKKKKHSKLLSILRPYLDKEFHTQAYSFVGDFEGLSQTELDLVARTYNYLASLPWTKILFTSGIIAGVIAWKLWPEREYETCVICQEPLKRNIAQLPCQHSFHKDCVRDLYTNSWSDGVSTIVKRIMKEPTARDQELWVAARSSDIRSYFQTMTDYYARRVRAEIDSMQGQVGEDNIFAHILLNFWQENMLPHLRSQFKCPLCRDAILAQSTNFVVPEDLQPQ